MLAAASGLGLATSCDPPPEPAGEGYLEDLSREIVSDGGLAGSALPPNTISLTYDDGPDAHTLPLATWLSQQGIRATFFINGCRLQGSPLPIPQSGSCIGTPQVPPSTIATLVALGHRVANHTEDHPFLPDLVPPTATVISQMRLTQAMLDPSISDGYYFMRPPYGAWTTQVANAVRTDPTLDRLVGPMLWDLDGGDWDCFRTGNSVATCGQRYLDALMARPNRNGVVLMHDRLEFNVGTDLALQLTQWLVARLPRPQYTFVPLDAIPDLPGTRQAAAAQLWTSHFGNSEGWAASPSFYRTIRSGDLNGDGRQDVCGRLASGVYCATSTGSSFTGWRAWITSDFTDLVGWAPEQYSTTLRLGDVNGDGRADLCGRGNRGMICALSTGSAFAPPRLWSSGADYADPDGWGGDVGYYGTIRLGDINGDGRADVCGRGIAGIYCALSNGTRFLPKTGWKVDDFHDTAGWHPAEYSTTIQLADVNGDGRADVCGRGGILACALANSAGTGFGPMRWSNMFGDLDGWATSSSRYGSIRWADLDGDGKADVCGRNATGVVCASAVGDGTFTRYRYLVNAEYRDDLGWGVAQHGETMLLGDLGRDGRADLCGRASFGMLCSVSP